MDNYPPIYRYENHSWEQLPAEEKAEAELERHRISAHKEVDIHRSMSIIPGYCDQKKNRIASIDTGDRSNFDSVVATF